MRSKITKRSVEAISPGSRDIFLWDTELRGFGCKITPKGSRIYIFQYWKNRRARRYTIGRHGEGFTPDEARREALRLKSDVARGNDPAESKAAYRSVPTLAEFAQRYLTEHAFAKKKPLSASADEVNLRKHIIPSLGTFRMVDITRADIARFHHGLLSKPGAANRCLALLSKMLNLAERWGLRPDGTNPVRHIERYPERKFERYLSGDELNRLGQVLREAETEGEHPSVVAAIRLLALTGCRRGEIMTLKWENVDFDRRCLRLSDSKTGPKIVPLGSAAIKLLEEFPRSGSNPYVLPGKKKDHHYVGLEKAWRRLRKRAELSDVRLHDLRHSFASTAASMGESLIFIGSLLGHTDTSTTARYTHLSTQPLHRAAERISEQIAAALKN